MIFHTSARTDGRFPPDDQKAFRHGSILRCCTTYGFGSFAAVCVFQTKTVFSTRRHPARPASAPISSSVLDSRGYTRFVATKTTPQRYCIAPYAVSAADNAMPCRVDHFGGGGALCKNLQSATAGRSMQIPHNTCR